MSVMRVMRVKPSQQERTAMSEVTIIGVDLAKRVCVDAAWFARAF
jgi:hypothetical protein